MRHEERYAFQSRAALQLYSEAKPTVLLLPGPTSTFSLSARQLKESRFPKEIFKLDVRQVKAFTPARISTSTI
jgi:hypothetical protein